MQMTTVMKETRRMGKKRLPPLGCSRRTIFVGGGGDANDRCKMEVSSVISNIQSFLVGEFFLADWLLCASSWSPLDCCVFLERLSSLSCVFASS
jgi:hypothetical protein